MYKRQQQHRHDVRPRAERIVEQLRECAPLDQPVSYTHLDVYKRQVQTFVMEHDWNVLCDAMRRELQRGGQVFYPVSYTHLCAFSPVMTFVPGENSAAANV